MMQDERYGRQVILPQLGAGGQELLGRASVLVIGAGGLGCPVLQYLCAAGVGRLTVMDHDVVELSNLHRQVLYTEDHLGLPKVDVAVSVLQRMNSNVKLRGVREQLVRENAFDLVGEHDLVMDCTDNFSTRYLVNDVCVVLGKPLVYGAVSGLEGQVAVFNVEGSGNYRDLFPEMPAAGEVLNCAEAGVLGVMPGIIGTLMALEAVKYITGVGALLVNRLMTYHGQSGLMMNVGYTARGLEISRAFVLNADYDGGCDLSWRVGVKRLTEFLGDGSLVVDVRGPGELPIVDGFAHIKIPLAELDSQLAQLQGRRVLFFCRTGQRSGSAAARARAVGIEAYSLDGFPIDLQGQDLGGADLGGRCE